MSAVQVSAVDPVPPQAILTQTAPWEQANQACLVMEFARLHHRLASAARPSPDAGSTPTSSLNDVAIDDILQQLHETRESISPPTAIDTLAGLFGLSPFERDILLLCAGIEMDSGLAQICRDALGRDHRSSVTFALALATLDEPHWSALAPSAPLRRFQLLQMDPGHGLTTAPLRIDERILHYLAGVNQIDSRLENLLRPRSETLWIAPEHQTQASQILESGSLTGPESAVLHLCGDDPRGQEDIAALVGDTLGRQVFVLAAEDIPGPAASASSETGASDISQLANLWTREAALLPGILLIRCGTVALSQHARQLIERLSTPLILASRDPIRLHRSLDRYTVNKPSPAGQKRLWMEALGTGAESLNGDLDDLSEQFRLSAAAIASVGRAATSHRATPDPGELWKACRSLSRPRLEDLAERILPSAGWSDLILPAAQKQTLRQLAVQARFRMTVYESWGFAERGRRGLGITALFAGASGTGKTLAAEVLAGELRLDLYRIDLSAVVSKYIGESEKNLKQVFDAAEEGGVLLLFDEADALFGKRGEVKDSHDRYANIEVSYLLQRMESFQGLAVLTTNLKSSLDKAFQRRLRFSIDFPFPGAAEREGIWQRVFPSRTPTHQIDPKRLAQLNMTGGNIRNIALNAAFLAAEAGSPVGMEHLLQATRQEAVKIERPLAEAEIRGWL